MSATRRPLEAAGKLHTRVVELTALCAELERARQSAEAALLAKSAEYDALVALPAAWRAWRNDPDHPVEGCASDERAAEIFDRCADDLSRLLVSDDRPSHAAGEK